MFEQDKDIALKDELMCGDALEDIAMEMSAKIPDIDLQPHGCNCPYENLELISSAKDVGHDEYVNQYQCTTCGAKVTNFHRLHVNYTA